MKKNTGTTSSLHYFKYKLISALNDSMILFYGGTDPLQSECYTLFEKLSSMDEFRSFYLVWILSDPEAHMDLLNFHHTILVREHSKECMEYFARARYWVHDEEHSFAIHPGRKRMEFALSKNNPDSHAGLMEQCRLGLPHRHSLTENCVIYVKKTLNRIHLVWLIIRYNILGFFRSRGLLHNNNSLRLERLKDSHKGQRCFLIGNGPSLNGHDLDLLKDEFTFGTNMVYKIFDQTEWRPTFHCVSDSIYASKLGTELSEKVKSPLFTTERTYRRMKKKPVDTTYIHSIQSERYKVKGNIQSYCMVKATVLSLATEMAFHMGFSEIYLLGVDCTNPHGKGGHFTDNYATKEVAETDINRIKTRMKMKSMTTQQIGEHIIDRSMEVYSLLHDYAEKKGVHIYNATRGGHLEIFPRVTLEDVLNLDKE